MEFRIIVKKGLDGFLLHVFLIAPLAVRDDHLAELRAVVAEMVQAYDVPAGRLVQLRDGSADDGAADMADVAERI